MWDISGGQGTVEGMDIVATVALAALVAVPCVAGLLWQWVRANKMHEAQASAEAILEAAVDGIVTIDEQARILGLNRAAERIFGYKPSEVIGRNVAMLMPEPYRSAHDRYMQNYLTTGHARIIGIGREVVGQRKDGSTFPMDLAVGESRVGGRRLFAGIIRDITERKRTEERLRQSEERFRLLVDAVRDYAIVTLTEDGRIASWNQGAERAYGWAAEEVVGRHFSVFFPPDNERHRELQKQLLDSGRVEDEGWRVRKDGSRFWAHVAMNRLVDEAGRVRGYVRISRDMTERKWTEEALRRAKDEAERANLSKSKFLAAASHDLRQPVQALFFFTAALSRRLPGGESSMILTDLERSLDAINLLLDGLLDISKLDAGVIQPQFQAVAVQDLLERLSAEYGPQAQAQGLGFTVVPSTGLVQTDPALLARVLQNLVSNALRYTREGRVLVGCRVRDSHLSVQVWDTGVGIPAERIDEIFHEFTQVGNPERDRAQGLGLGLAIVDRIVKLLGHRVSVRSVPGRGSVFQVEMPLIGRRFWQSAPPGPQPESRRDQGLVVLIDDEALVLRGLQLVLEEWGFEVLTAGSQVEAERSLRQMGRAPVAIVADYRLRDEHTGREAIDAIRTLFAKPIPSIIITGDTGPERLREAEASGYRILHKPVTPVLLHQALEQAITRAA